jgi:demethylmenaquinone methyltransferase/2-methoxy-6-polyprenyl-1,4-benzoquinol methylase
MNNLMTGFSHMRTRKKALQLVPVQSDQIVLDLATGTGDFVFTTRKIKKEIEMIIGIDIAEEMLSIAKNRSRKEGFMNKTSFSLADITYLPFQAETFNLCTIGYGIRNLANPMSVLREILRVTKESGYLLIVEATPANNSIVRFLSVFYFRNVIPIITRLLFLETNAYKYLAESIAQFPSVQQFVKIIKRAGWKKVTYRPLYCGAVTIFFAKK